MKKQDVVKIIRSHSGMRAYGLVLLVFLVMWGCGSDSQQPPKHVPEKAKPVVDRVRVKPKWWR